MDLVRSPLVLTTVLGRPRHPDANDDFKNFQGLTFSREDPKIPNSPHAAADEHLHTSVPAKKINLRIWRGAVLLKTSPDPYSWLVGGADSTCVPTRTLGLYA